jgi:hypothetical protein
VDALGLRSVADLNGWWVSSFVRHIRRLDLMSRMKHCFFGIRPGRLFSIVAPECRCHFASLLGFR